jgi:hypothetical protein
MPALQVQSPRDFLVLPKKKKKSLILHMVVHTCNPNIQEAEARVLQVSGQSGLHCDKDKIVNKFGKDMIQRGSKIRIIAECWYYTCNPSYSGGRDQEDQGSKPVQANNS